ncbi:transcription factor S [Methanocalculus sp.]|uniref:transcription factor S n=1 Tax=Methanocalculus sp. TaxID=2004547 RepID=UPI0026318FC2|nr:transcription factor S [Methanocalculus sp.]MDG6249559.1 transcription factor S [Methanocalculus sp.]
MRFCPECKSLMIARSGKMHCRRCDYSEDITDSESLKVTKTRVEKEIVIVDEDDAIPTLPTCAIRCPECDHNVAYWWLRQLRSADESEVRFFRCVSCSHTWRQYD